LPDTWASFVFSLVILSPVFVLLWCMYRKRWFVRL